MDDAPQPPPDLLPPPPADPSPLSVVEPAPAPAAEAGTAARPFTLDDPPPPAAPPPVDPPLPAPKARREPHPTQTVRRLLHTATAFLILFLFLRTFAVEPFGVPTGSMAPTLAGNHREEPCPRCGHSVRVGDTASDREKGRTLAGDCPNCGRRGVELPPSREVQGDRLLVDKTVFALRSPRRWEVAVFRCPVDLSKPYVKRVVGLPGEAITLRGGDAYADGELIRKGLAEVRETRIPVYELGYSPQPDGWGPRWLADAPGQDPRLPPVSENKPVIADATVLTADGLVLDASAGPQATTGLTYRHWNLDDGKEEAVRAWNGYNGTAPRRNLPPPAHDFCLSCEVEVTAGRGTFAARLFDGADSVNVELAAGSQPGGTAVVSREKHSEPTRAAPFTLETGKRYRLEFAFVDRRVSLAIDGKEVVPAADLPKPAKRGEVSRPLQLGVRGCRVVVRDLTLFTDIYYTTTPGAKPQEPWRLAADEYFMLGDNSGNSQDSREWRGKDGRPAPGVPEADFIGKPFLIHQPLRLGRVSVGGQERVFQTLDWSRLRWLH